MAGDFEPTLDLTTEEQLDPAVELEAARLRRQANILLAVAEAKEAIDAYDAEAAATPVVEDKKVTARNRVLAGSGPKAEILGTISTAPTLTAADLVALGCDEAFAASVIATRDTLRTKALAVAPVGPGARK